MKIRNEEAFTLVELVVVVGILAVVLTGMIQLFLLCSVQSQIAGNKTLAVTEAQSKLEEIKDYSYANIAADYASGGAMGNTFSLDALTGIGRVEIDSSDPELLQIAVIICWQDKYDRIIGEDKNLNGVLDAGEDADGDGQYDSPVRLTSLITRR